MLRAVRFSDKLSVEACPAVQELTEHKKPTQESIGGTPVPPPPYSSEGQIWILRSLTVFFGPSHIVNFLYFVFEFLFHFCKDWCDY